MEKKGAAAPFSHRVRQTFHLVRAQMNAAPAQGSRARAAKISSMQMCGVYLTR